MASITVLPEVAALEAEIIENRRYFHAHPELSFEEHATAARIAKLLRGYGLDEVFEGVGRTGVVGLVRGGAGPGPCVALRADMDALPLQETAEVEYRSQNKGVMHACGHDGHCASLLAAARVLFATRSSLCGTVMLLFQPAEEGYGGAREMIADGVLEEGSRWPRVDTIYGIHLWTYHGLGTVGVRDGPMMAASDKFGIVVKGKGGHGAAPQGTVDAVVTAAHLVTALQTIVSRNVDPLEPAVVTCGSIHGGTGYNIISDRVELGGTTRSFTPEVQELIKGRMRDVCCGIGAAFGAEVELDYMYGYPPTVNAYPECVEAVRRAARQVVGPAGVPADFSRTCGAEDFSYFLQKRPGAFIFIGAGLPGELRPHHKSVFDFDERALGVSASVFVLLVREALGEAAEGAKVAAAGGAGDS